MKRASGPAKTSAQWRKEVARARRKLHRGMVASAVHAAVYLLPALLAGIGAPVVPRGWGVVLWITVVLLILGGLTRMGSAAAAFVLMTGALASFAVPLVQGHGLSLEMVGLVFAWFYFEALRAALALKRRLHAPAIEKEQ